MSSEMRVILIHGAGLDAGIWQDVTPNLDCPSSGIDLPMRGQNIAQIAALSLDDYVESVLAEVDAFDEPNVVLIGHSIGAVIAALVAVRTSKSVVGFVVIGGLLPLRGESFASCLPFPQRFVLPILLRLLGTKPPEAEIRNSLCDRLSEKQADEIVKNFIPESRRLFTDHVVSDLPDIRSLYIKLMADQELPPTLQEKMARRLNRCSIKELDCGHLPMIENPVALSGALNEFIQSVSK